MSVAPRPVAGVPREQVAELQRLRLLAAAVAAVDELGYGRVTVADVTARARVSRRTFYELFANREECLATVSEGMVELISAELAAAGLDGLPWRERVRRGLWAVLTCLDREPGLARVCVIGTLGGGPAVLERREQLLGALARAVDEGRREGPRGASCTPLTAEGLVGAACAIVHARLRRDRGARGTRARARLTALQGELMAMIVLPYLGPAAARQELRRPAPAAPAEPHAPASLAEAAADPWEGMPMRLTYRTTRVLAAVAQLRDATNRQVAEYAGISDQGQVSKILARLERLGVLANHSEGHVRGQPNAWRLTPKGQRIAYGVSAHARERRRVA